MKIIANHVTAKFIDLTDAERNKLDSAFAVQDKRLFFMPKMKRLLMAGIIDGKVKFFNRRNDTIPTGLIPKVLTLFPNAEVQRLITQEQWDIFARSKEIVKTVEVNGITFRDDQRPAMISAIENMRGIIKGATNFGKTPVGAGIIKSLQVPTLWVIHRKSLLSETAERLEGYLGVPVGRIGDGHKTTGTLVTVGVDKSIKNRGSEWLKQFNCVIFDEAQHLSCDTQMDIANGLVCAPWRYAMSGKFPNDKLKLFSAMAAADATLLYEIKNKELIEAGISARPIVHIKPLRYPPLVNGLPLYGFDYPAAQEYCIYGNEFFANIVVADTEKWVNEDKTVMIFAGLKKQALNLCKKLDEKGISNAFIDKDTPTFARKEYLRKFGKKELAVIVSMLVLTEGIDCPSMGCVIMASGKKSDGELLQKVGRSIRKKPEGENTSIVQDYNFIGSKYTERHSKIRKKIYKDEGFEIIIDQEINLG